MKHFKIVIRIVGKSFIVYDMHRIYILYLNVVERKAKVKSRFYFAIKRQCFIQLILLISYNV